MKFLFLLVPTCLLLQAPLGSAQEVVDRSLQIPSFMITQPTEELNYIRPDLIEIQGPPLSATEMKIIHGISRAILDEILVYRYDDEFPDKRVQVRISLDSPCQDAQIVYGLLPFGSISRIAIWDDPDDLYDLDCRSWISGYRIPQNRSTCSYVGDFSTDYWLDFLDQAVQVFLVIDPLERPACVARMKLRDREWNRLVSGFDEENTQSDIDRILDYKECLRQARE